MVIELDVLAPITASQPENCHAAFRQGVSRGACGGGSRGGVYAVHYDRCSVWGKKVRIPNPRIKASLSRRKQAT